MLPSTAWILCLALIFKIKPMDVPIIYRLIDEALKGFYFGMIPFKIQILAKSAICWLN